MTLYLWSWDVSMRTPQPAISMLNLHRRAVPCHPQCHNSCPLCRGGMLRVKPVSHHVLRGMWTVGEKIFVVELWDANQVCYWLTRPPLECQWLLFCQAAALRDGVFVPFHMYSRCRISTDTVSRDQHLLLSHSSPWACLLHFTECEPR